MNILAIKLRSPSETANVFCLQNLNLKSRPKHRYQLTPSKFYTVSLNIHAVNDVIIGKTQRFSTDQKIGTSRLLNELVKLHWILNVGMSDVIVTIIKLIWVYSQTKFVIYCDYLQYLRHIYRLCINNSLNQLEISKQL